MFRLSLRELFLLTVIAALMIGWWLDFRHTRRVMANERYYVQLRIQEMETKLLVAKYRVERAEKIARMKRYLPILAMHPPGSAYWVSGENRVLKAHNMPTFNSGSTESQTTQTVVNTK